MRMMMRMINDIIIAGMDASMDSRMDLIVSSALRNLHQQFQILRTDNLVTFEVGQCMPQLSSYSYL